MKCESFQQYAIVAADSAQELTEQLNAKLIELKDKRPQVTFEGLIARISYTERVEVIECLSDEYSKIGVKLSCRDCPMFQPTLNRDGSINQRMKRGGCRFAEYGMTFCDSPACDLLFKMLNNGEVRLCLTESEN